MLNVLVVEDDKLVAPALGGSIELNPGYRIVGYSDDLESSLAVLRSANVHIAFVDIHLRHTESGFRVADELRRRGVSCVLVTGSAIPFAMPEFAVDCLEKPWTATQVARALHLAAADLYGNCSPGKASAEALRI